MSGTNLHKSPEQWARLNERVAARQGVRTAQRTDYRAAKPQPEAPVAKPLATVEEAMGTDFIVRKGRKMRRAFVAHNGRSE